MFILKGQNWQIIYKRSLKSYKNRILKAINEGWINDIMWSSWGFVKIPSKGMRWMMCGAWMKRAYLDMFCQTVDLAGREKKVKKGSSESQLHVTYLLQVKMKSLLLSEDPRCLLISLVCQFSAWMTGKILKAALTKLNHHLSSSNNTIFLIWIMQVVTLMSWL